MRMPLAEPCAPDRFMWIGCKPRGEVVWLAGACVPRVARNMFRAHRRLGGDRETRADRAAAEDRVDRPLLAGAQRLAWLEALAGARRVRPQRSTVRAAARA